MKGIEHFSWCAAAQNMGRPRSQQLIGPQCHCTEHREKIARFKARVDSGEFDEALGIASKGAE